VTPANQQTYLADNVTAFSNILNLALELKVPNFIYASSSSIYQSAKISPFIESENLSAPTNFYARTKFIDEKLAESFSELISNVCGLRFFSAYGPWGRPDMAYFKLFQAAYSGSEFLLNGDGEISRDFTFIDDVTNSLLKLIDSSFVLPRVLNIGGGNVHTMNELVSNIQNITGRKIKVSRLAENQQDLRVTNADTSLQKSTLGDYPKIDLFHGLGVMDNWIKSLPDLDTFIKW
jgi:UDP-glucuronate 4-epimerase